MKSAKTPSNTPPRGFTLVELMIVVAIIGVLAAIGGVAYVKYVKSAKITQLKQYAMEVAGAQEQYKSRNSQYLDLQGTPYSKSEDKWTKLLGFSQTVPDNVTIRTAAGTSGDTCPAAVCGTGGKTFSSLWYAVSVEQDLNPDSSEETTVRFDSELANTLVFFEGE